MPKPLPRLGGPQTAVGSTPASSTGIALFGNATANTKASSFTVLSSNFVSDVAWLTIQAVTLTANQQSLFDVAWENGDGGVATVIPDLYAGISTTLNAPLMATYLFPAMLPKSGSAPKLLGKAQSSVSSGACDVCVQAHAPGAAGFSGYARHEACGIDAGTTGLTTCSVGGTAHTDSAWAQLIAATSFDYHWLNIVVVHEKNTAGSTGTFLVDIGVGAGGSEVEIVSDILAAQGSSTDAMVTCISLPKDIPAGSRIAARARSTIIAATDRNAHVALWGSG